MFLNDIKLSVKRDIFYFLLLNERYIHRMNANNRVYYKQWINKISKKLL